MLRRWNSDPHEYQIKPWIETRHVTNGLFFQKPLEHFTPREYCRCEELHTVAGKAVGKLLRKIV